LLQAAGQAVRLLMQHLLKLPCCVARHSACWPN
jgi:hypothetical protein